MQKVQLIEAILTALYRSLSLAMVWSQNENTLTPQRFAAISQLNTNQNNPVIIMEKFTAM